MNASPSSAAPASPFADSAPRVVPNQGHAFGGIWRLTWRRYLLPGRWVAVVIALAVLTLLCFSAGARAARSNHFINWAIGFYVVFLVPAFAFMAAGGAIRDEMKSGTVDYVLTRPVRRPAFIVFKFLSHLACAQVDFLLSFGVIVGFAIFHQTEHLGSIVPKLLLGQVLLVLAASALGFLAGILTARYVVIGILYAAVIEAGVGQIPTQLSRLSMTHQVRDLLDVLVNGATELTSAPSLFWTIATLLAYTGVMLAAAAAVFAWRELTSPADA